MEHTISFHTYVCLLLSILQGKWEVEGVSRECIFMTIVLNCLHINESNCCALHAWLLGWTNKQEIGEIHFTVWENLSILNFSYVWEQFKPKCTYEECIHVMCIGQPIFFDVRTTWFNVILFGGHIVSRVWLMLSVKPQINWREIFAHHANTFTNHDSS